MDKRKILILMPAMGGGGAERILLNVLHQMDYSRFQIDLVLGVKRGELLNQVPSEIRMIHLFSNEFLFRVVTFFQKKIGLKWIQKWKFTQRIHSEYDVGISYLDGNMTDYLAFSDKIKNRIAWVHSSYVTNKNFNKFYQNTQYVENLKRNRYAPLDKICFVSEDCKKEFIEVFGTFPKMEVIYNFIHSTEVLKKSTQQEIVPVEDFTFVAIGSLIPVKGYDVLIKAAALLKERGHSFKVRIVGRGAQEHQLKQMVETQGLSSFFQFDGFVSNPYPILKSADAFVMTSVSEANPTALCEALVLGKPSIVVNAPGCREIIGQGSFGIMTERTPEEFANGMERVLVNPELREELKIRAKSRSKDFDDATVLSQYMQIFKE